MDLFTLSTQALAGQVKRGAEETQRGATFDHVTIFSDGHQRHVKDCLRDGGIDCWGENSQSFGCSIDVRKQDRKEALRLLRRNNYEAW